MEDGTPTFMVSRIRFKPWILVWAEGYVPKVLFVSPDSFGLDFMHR